MDNLQKLVSLLWRVLELEASDLHLTTDWFPVYRTHGKLIPDGDLKLSREAIYNLIDVMLSEKQKALFKEKGQIDLGYSPPDSPDRFRVNAYMEMGKPSVVFRYLNNNFKTMEELRLPEQLNAIPKMKHGLVLVTGATGSGKSTTLATMLNEINLTRNEHMLLIEDPVEFVHTSNQSLIHQREVHSDVDSFADSLRAALRQDPDVIMVGEMRDLETMKAALTAAETGHLVFSTLHTGDAVGVVDRLIGSFPGDEQEVARNRIAGALKAVIAQRLLPTVDGNGRAAAMEILMVTPGVSNLINSGKTQQIYSMMEGGKADGMQTLEQSLLDLIRQRLIAQSEAMSHTRNPAVLQRLIDGAGIAKERVRRVYD